MGSGRRLPEGVRGAAQSHEMADRRNAVWGQSGSQALKRVLSPGRVGLENSLLQGVIGRDGHRLRRPPLYGGDCGRRRIRQSVREEYCANRKQIGTAPEFGQCFQVTAGGGLPRDPLIGVREAVVGVVRRSCSR